MRLAHGARLVCASAHGGRRVGTAPVTSVRLIDDLPAWATLGLSSGGGNFMNRIYLAIALVAMFPGSGCTGSVEGSGGSGGGGGTGPGGGGQPGIGGSVSLPVAPTSVPTADACTTNVPGPRRMRRLSASEFAASIRGIFNDPTVPVSAVFSDPGVLGFSVDANALLVQGLNASQLMDNAEAVASWAVANGKLSQFATCATVDPTCGRQFIQAFGRRAFRTTIADADPRIADYSRIFMAEGAFESAAQAVISAMLQSPYFLYRSERGTPAGTGFDLTPAEVASSLAYLLTGNMPDDTLLAAADSVAGGGLTMSAMVDQQTERLLSIASPNRAMAVMGFMTGWLGLDRVYTTAKNDTVFMLTNAMRDNMAAETRSLILEAFDGAGSFSTLLTADHSFLNQDLANYYGLDATGLSTALVSVPFTPNRKRDTGLLAHGTILNGYARPDASSPTQRGHLVRSRILCQAVPPPPANVDATLKPATTAKTTRQHIEGEHSLGACDTCHKLMDPIGFGFEHYDGFGRYRDVENGVPIDASGTLVDVNARDGSPTFNGLAGPSGLATYLADSDDVRQCLIRYWSYYSYGSPSWTQDACTYNSIYKEAASQGFALRAVLTGIIHAPTFTRRVQDR